MSSSKKITLTHLRADAGGADCPETTPGQVNSFTAEEFAEYEQRLQPEKIQAPARAFLAPRSEHGQVTRVTRPVSMPAYLDGCVPHFDDYGKNLMIKEADALEGGYSNESGITLELNNAQSLPDKRQGPLVRNVRHQILNVYRRVATVIILANLTALVAFVGSAGSIFNILAEDAATAASVNIFFSILIRQEWVVNGLYNMCLSVPRSAPLRLRCSLAKIYENGGFHSGCAYAGTVWFILLCIVLTKEYINNKLVVGRIASLTIAYLTLLALAVILGFSLPWIRMRYHNAFEYTHRFVGWIAVALFWALTFLVADNKRTLNSESFGDALIGVPSFWYLMGITIMIVSPWMLLRKVRFTTENLSDHALRLYYNEDLDPFRGVALAESPFGQYHSFATFPHPDSDEPYGQSIIISKAGDWTTKQIVNKDTKRHYWMRGTPKTGVLGMSLIFRRVVMVTTGSGIGPCLAFLNLPANMRRPCRVLWSSPHPEAIYGKKIFDSVQACDPDALIWDTRAQGRPDMLQLTYDLYRESGAEAVFVISNPALTKFIVYGMESRGVPAFGPIWDS